MKRLLILAPAAALAAGCSGGADQIQPGQWETTIQFSSIDIPGAPPEALEQMRQMMTQPQTSTQCITPEQAANPVGDLASPGGEAANCTYEEQVFAGGEIRMRGTCNPPGQGRVQMSMEGSYTPTTMEAEISSQVTPPAGGAAAGGPQSVSMTGNFTARRTGDCPTGS